LQQYKVYGYLQSIINGRESAINRALGGSTYPC
jgi:hypothetical protein